MYGRAEVMRMRGMAAHIGRGVAFSQDSLPPPPPMRHKHARLAGLAQLVEQRFCKAKVAGSSPAAGASSLTFPQVRTMTLTAWALTTGEAGMRTQARGLAAAVADVVVEKTVAGGFPWPWARPAPESAMSPPWPDVVVSCGRRSVARSLAIGRASGGRAVTVHVQDPRGRAEGFDLVVAMEHDRIAPAANVIKVATALHDLTPENLAEAGRLWKPRFVALGG